jgi:hypothetical protein
MWAYYTVITYFALALLTPVVWALGRVYRRASGRRSVLCPTGQESTLIELDAGHAARTHALGKAEARVRNCAHWPDRQGCGRECLTQIHVAA